MKVLLAILIVSGAMLLPSMSNAKANFAPMPSYDYVGTIPAAHLQACLEAASQAWNWTLPLTYKYYENGRLTIEIVVTGGEKHYEVDYEGLCVVVLVVGI